MRFLILALSVVLTAAAADAQRGSVAPRYGAGFDVATAVLGQDVIPDGPSIGIRGRVAIPVNADLSVAGSLGLGAHLFGGSDDTRYVLNPQVSVIVMLPSDGSARYVLGGFGGFLPFSGGGGGPSLHLGYGIAIPLTDTSLYAEVDPSLVIGDTKAVPVLAVRTGVIF